MLKNKKSRGLGDTIEKITEATGIKQFISDWHPGCGCKKRKEKLNKMFPYNENTRK